MRLMQGCLSSLGALQGWFDFKGAWDGSRALVAAQFEERGRPFSRMVRENAARRLPVTVLEGGRGAAGRRRGGSGVTDGGAVVHVIRPAQPEVPGGALASGPRALVDRTRVLRGLTRGSLLVGLRWTPRHSATC